VTGRWRHRTPGRWKTPVTVTGPVHRTPDGYLAAPGAPVTVRGCLVAPSASAAPGLTDPAASEAPETSASLYAPPGAPIHHRDTVTIPPGHPLAGAWAVEAPPAPWPLGLVVALTRR